MFMCKYCLEQFDDERLAYILMPESRMSHPAADAFALKFCSRSHLVEFLQRISNQNQSFALTRVTGEDRETFPAARPLELLHQMSQLA
mgnify:CR=1 FL=1